MFEFGETLTSEAQKNGFYQNNSLQKKMRITPLANTNALNNTGESGANNPYVMNPKRRAPLFKEEQFLKQIQR